MQITFILTSSLIVLLISFSLFSKAAGTLSPLKLNMISYVFYVQIVLLTYVGSILVVCHLVDFHHLVERVSDSNRIFGWLCVLYSMIAMPLAMIFLNKIFKVDTKEAFNNYIIRPIEFRQGPLLSIVVLMVFTTISALVLFYTIANSKSVPIFTLLFGDVKEAAIQRVEVRNNFEGVEYIRNLLGYYMMPVFAYYSAIYAFEKRKLVYWGFFIVNALLALFLIVFDIQKAPVVFFFLGFIILYTLRKGGVSRKRLVIYFFTGLFLISGGYSLTQDTNLIDQITDVGSALWGRVFITEYAGFPLSLEYFHNIISQPTWYIGLPSFVLDFLGFKNAESARLLMMEINPEGVARGEANLISSYYMAEAWANYGWAGLLLSPFIVGTIVQAVHLFLLKNKKEPLIIAFYAYLTFRWTINSGFVYFLYLKIILFPMVLYFIFKMIINSLANKKGKNLPSVYR